MDLDDMLKSAIENIKSAIKSEEIVGTPIVGEDGSIILPVSKLSYGFVVGGGEYGKQKPYPYTGASGGGVTVTPIGFLVCGSRDKRFISASAEQPSKLAEWIKTAVNTAKRD